VVAVKTELPQAVVPDMVAVGSALIVMVVFATAGVPQVLIVFVIV